MTVLEKRLSKERLLMTLNKEDVRNLSVQVPAGMVPVDRKERIRYRDAWCELLVRLGFEADLKHAYGRFDGMVEKDEKFFLDHLYLLRESDGRLASACGLWYGNDFKEERLRLHYVLTNPQSQKKGAAHYVVSQAVLAYFHMYDSPLYLSTQAQSWPAIRLYCSIGFRPYIGDCLKFDRDTAERRWLECVQSVTELTGSDQFK